MVKKKKKSEPGLKELSPKALKKFAKEKVIVRKVLRTPKQLKITIKKQPVQEQVKSQFFKQELIGAQNVLFGN